MAQSARWKRCSRGAALHGDRGLSMLEFEKAVELALSQRLDTL
ncbi:hypothetical protein [Scytonema sp. PCC 10023]